MKVMGLTHRTGLRTVVDDAECIAEKSFLCLGLGIFTLGLRSKTSRIGCLAHSAASTDE